MKKRSSGRFIALITVLCLICISAVLSVGAVPSDTQQDKGVVNVKVAGFAQSTSLAICQVGEFERGAYVLNDSFSGCDADLSDLTEASSAQAAAEKLAAYAKESDILKVGVLDSEGVANYTSLDCGNKLYLIYQLDGEDIVEISPMLVVLPYYNNEGAELTTVNVNAKYKDKRSKEEKGAVIIKKVDPKKTPLKGAEFVFEVKTYVLDELTGQGEGITFYTDGAGTYYWDTVAKDLSTDKNGQIAIDKLPLGTYRLTETKAPAGYVLDETPREVNVNKGGAVKRMDGIYVAAEGEPVELDVLNKPEETSTPSTPESSEPSEPSKPESSTPQPSQPPVITGDQIAKYIIVGVVVGVSLIVVVLLIVFGKKKKKNDDDD